MNKLNFSDVMKASAEASQRKPDNIKCSIGDIRKVYFEHGCLGQRAGEQFCFGKNVKMSDTVSDELKAQLVALDEAQLYELCIKISEIPKCLPVTTFNVEKVLKIEGYGQDLRTHDELKAFALSTSTTIPEMLVRCRGEIRKISPTSFVTVTKGDEVQHLPIVQGMIHTDYLKLDESAYNVLEADTAVNAIVNFLISKTRVLNGKFTLRTTTAPEYLLDGYTAHYTTNAMEKISLLMMHFNNWFRNRKTIMGYVLTDKSNLVGRDYGHALYGFITLELSLSMKDFATFIRIFNEIFTTPPITLVEEEDKVLLTFNSFKPANIRSFKNSKIDFKNNVEFSTAVAAQHFSRNAGGENDSTANLGMRSSILGAQLDIDLVNLIAMSSNLSVYKFENKMVYVKGTPEVVLNVLFSLAVLRVTCHVHVPSYGKLTEYLSKEPTYYKLKVDSGLKIHLVTSIDLEIVMGNAKNKLLIDLSQPINKDIKSSDATVRSSAARLEMQDRMAEWHKLKCGVVSRSSYFVGIHSSQNSSLDSSAYMPGFDIISPVELSEGVVWVSKDAGLTEKVFSEDSHNRYNLNSGDAGQFLKAMTLVNLHRIYYMTVHINVYSLLVKHIKVPKMIRSGISIFAAAANAVVDFGTLTEEETVFYCIKGNISQKIVARTNTNGFLRGREDSKEEAVIEPEEDGFGTENSEDLHK